MQGIENIENAVAHPFVGTAHLRMGDLTRPKVNHLLRSRVFACRGLHLEEPACAAVPYLKIIAQAIITSLVCEVASVVGLPARQVDHSVLTEAPLEPIENYDLPEEANHLALFIGEPRASPYAAYTTTVGIVLTRHEPRGNATDSPGGRL